MMGDLIERLFEHLGWLPPAEEEGRLRDQERRLEALEARIAVKERQDRAAIARLDELERLRERAEERRRRESRGDR